MKTEKFLSHLRKCVHDYDLIRPGDTVAVGVSGGKDSLALLYGLTRLSHFEGSEFRVIGIHVDAGWNSDITAVRSWCESLGVPLHVEKTQISEIIFGARKEENPCSLCANMRRGALVNAALSLGASKLALGHHRDDYLNTLMLSLVYEGRFYSFAPKTAYEDREIEIMRPMLYVPEAAVRNYAEEMHFPVLKNPCPADHMTKREEISELIGELQKRYPDIKDRLFHALVTSDIPDWKNSRNTEER